MGSLEFILSPYYGLVRKPLLVGPPKPPLLVDVCASSYFLFDPQLVE